MFMGWRQLTAENKRKRGCGKEVLCADSLSLVLRGEKIIAHRKGGND
jgi:hypothetical protein